MEDFDAFVGSGGDHASSRPFDGDEYAGYDPRLPSQRFDSFRAPEENYGEDHYTQGNSKGLGDLDEEDEFGAPKGASVNSEPFDFVGNDKPSPFHSGFDDEIGDGHSSSMSANFGQSFEPSGDFSGGIDSNGKSHSGGFGYGYPPDSGFQGGASVLPPPEEMQAEDGYPLREWKRKNAIHLEEKAKNEREKLSQIIDAADAYKDSFYEKRRAHCVATKNNNREKEKVFLENHKNFHATAEKHYWKAVAELVPHELPTIETKGRGKSDPKKPAVVINHGPKPGKATDLTRMRQVLVKLKHNPPAHMKAPPLPPAAPATGADTQAKANKESSGDTSAQAPAPQENK
ncbi:hypothetical protein KP509_20G037000 [Ceratopteris richardii]|uniref:Clathrin light chain n=1 Tax=Ceratopteris richardii TaxID=49495 RepID=A0A8T2SHJ8_CERRI|nr:hypothetical protein KP509_20G037000 [Ceratopteris richardii]